jgi:hypothetical protein
MFYLAGPTVPNFMNPIGTLSSPKNDVPQHQMHTETEEDGINKFMARSITHGLPLVTPTVTGDDTPEVVRIETGRWKSNPQPLDSNTRVPYSLTYDKEEDSEDISFTPPEDDLAISRVPVAPSSDLLSEQGSDMDCDEDLDSEYWSGSASPEAKKYDNAVALPTFLQGFAEAGFIKWLQSADHRMCGTSPGENRRSRGHNTVDSAAQLQGALPSQKSTRKRSADDDDTSRDPQRLKVQSLEDEAGARLYACPFAKHHPFRYINCCRAGYRDLNRVKYVISFSSFFKAYFRFILQ